MVGYRLKKSAPLGVKEDAKWWKRNDEGRKPTVTVGKMFQRQQLQDIPKSWKLV